MTDWRDVIEDKHSEKKINGYFYVKNIGPSYVYGNIESHVVWGLCFKSDEFEAIILTSELPANTLVAKEALERIAKVLNNEKIPITINKEKI